jgi:hypothetical protein
VNVSVPVLQFSAVAYSANDSDGSVTITVTRTGGTGGTPTVNYATSDDTAVAGTDYTATSGTLSFNPGDTSKTFAVPLLNNGRTIGSETVNLALSSTGDGSLLGAPATAVLTIFNGSARAGQLAFSAANYSASEEGGSASITVTRTGGSSGLVGALYTTSDGTAVAGTDYTATSGVLLFQNGETSKTFAVPILNDGRADGSETVNLTLSNPVVGSTIGTPATAVLTITDGSAQAGQLAFSAANYSATEGGGAATVTVTRSAGSSGTVTVNYATSNGTAVAGTDYGATSGTLTFAAGVLSQAFAVPILHDGRADGSETVNLALSSPGGGATLGTPATATLTITDASAQAGELEFSAASYNATERSGGAIITISRTGGSAGAVTVGYATSNGTAVAGRDYTATSGTLTFNPGETSNSFVVPVLFDPGATGSQVVLLALSNPGGGATLGVPSNSVLIIADNVTPGGGSGGGGGVPGGGSQPPPGGPPITARLVTVKLRRKKKVLMVEVLFADTMTRKELLPSPFQKGAFRKIQVSVLGDQVVLTAKKGKRTVTATFPG